MFTRMVLLAFFVTPLLSQCKDGPPNIAVREKGEGSADIEAEPPSDTVTVPGLVPNSAAVIPAGLGSDAVVVAAGKPVVTEANVTQLGLGSAVEAGPSIRFLNTKPIPAADILAMRFIVPFITSDLSNFIVMYRISLLDGDVIGCLDSDNLVLNQLNSTVEFANQGFGDYQAAVITTAEGAASCEGAGATPVEGREEPQALAPPTFQSLGSLNLPEVFGIAVDETRPFVYVVGNRGFRSVNFTDTAAPASASLLLPQAVGGPVGPGRGVTVKNNVAMQADTFGAAGVNITNPNNLIAGVGRDSGNGAKIATNGTFAVIADTNGIRAVNFAVNVQIMGRYNPGAACVGIAMDDKIAVAACANGIYGVDVATLANLNPSGFLIEDAPSRGVAMANGFAYVVGDYGLKIYDVSNPAAVTARGTLSGLTGAQSISLQGNYAFIGSAAGIEAFDISSPDQPMAFTPKASVSSPANIRDMVVKDNLIHVVNDTGYFITSFTTP